MLIVIVLIVIVVHIEVGRFVAEQYVVGFCPVDCLISAIFCAVFGKIRGIRIPIDERQALLVWPIRFVLIAHCIAIWRLGEGLVHVRFRCG